VRRAAFLLLSTAFVILAGGPSPASPQVEPSTPVAAAGQQPAPRGTELAPLNDKLGAVLLNQSRLTTRLDHAITGLWVGLGLLALAALLAAAGLTLDLRQHRALVAIGRRLGELDRRLEAWSRDGPAGAPPPGGETAPQESGAGTVQTATGSSATTIGAGEGATGVYLPGRVTGEAGAAVAAAVPPTASATSTPTPASVWRRQGEPELPAPAPPALSPRRPESQQAPSPAAASEPPALPSALHDQVARLLAQLRIDAPRLAARFADAGTRERFLYELGAPLAARLDRFRTLSNEGEEQLRRSWLGPDLVTTLDTLARYYSAAVDEERHGHATGLAAELRAWLYDSFGTVCLAAGWFAIEPVDPYVTSFDPRLHHAVAGRDVDGAQGRIVDIKAIGRRDPASSAVAHKAEVVVGR
jgi:hypothetical protein